jgi:hypothetical protein
LAIPKKVAGGASRSCFELQRALPATDQAVHNTDYGKNQQDMDQAADHAREADETDEPSYDEQHDDEIE